MKRRFSWGAKRHWHNQDILHLLWNKKIHYHDHKSTPLIPTVSDKFSPPTHDPFNVYRNVILSYICRYPKWSYQNWPTCVKLKWTDAQTARWFHTPISVVPKLFRSTAPLVPYTNSQRPLPFFKKHKWGFVSTFILYLKNLLNKIIRVKLNVLCVN
jgi:hypothetical protein